ncbi:MAG TPA: MlaD family protein, partial [Kofleriaceae bacterium]|nr:MlaD family protein [Kofleriaceae bacterium]
MKGLSAGVRVGILFILLAVGAYLVWKNLGDSEASGGQQFFVRMRDASGLPTGSKVVVAGLKKGTVTKLEVDGRYAKIHFNLSRDIPVWSSAVVYKKASSLLGENYLEIDPGEQMRQAPDGTAVVFTRLGVACPDYNSSDDKKRDACREIKNRV